MPMPMAIRGPAWSWFAWPTIRWMAIAQRIALRLDDDAAVRLDLTADDDVLLVNDPGGRLIAELLGVVGKSPDVADKYGYSPAARHRRFGCGPRTASLALHVFAHLGGDSGGTKNSSRWGGKRGCLSGPASGAIFERRDAPLARSAGDSGAAPASPRTGFRGSPAAPPAAGRRPPRPPPRRAREPRRAPPRGKPRSGTRRSPR